MWGLKKEGRVVKVLDSEQMPDLSEFEVIDGDSTYEIVPIHITEISLDSELSDNELLQSAGKQIKELLNEILKFVDRSYYQVRISIACLDNNFQICKKVIILDEIEEGKGYCSFCGRKTNYFDSQLMMHLCAKDFAEIHNKAT